MVGLGEGRGGYGRAGGGQGRVRLSRTSKGLVR